MTAAVLLAALAVAAPVPKKDDKPPPKNYFPAAAGMRWEYQYDLNGRAMTYVETVTSIEEADGVEKITFRRESGPPQQRSATVYRIRIEKIYVQYAGKGDFDLARPLRIARRELTPGDTWEEVAIDGAIVVFAVGQPEEVTVPAGKFTALSVSERDKGKDKPGLVKWYADGVGEVKSERGGKVTELKAFDKGGKDK